MSEAEGVGSPVIAGAVILTPVEVNDNAGIWTSTNLPTDWHVIVTEQPVVVEANARLETAGTTVASRIVTLLLFFGVMKSTDRVLILLND